LTGFEETDEISQLSVGRSASAAAIVVEAAVLLVRKSRASDGCDELGSYERNQVDIRVPHGWEGETAFPLDRKADKVEETLDLGACDDQAMGYVWPAPIPTMFHVLSRDDAQIEKGDLNLAYQTLGRQR